jgi:peptide/nickel transport system substrate-binding protein
LISFRGRLEASLVLPAVCLLIVFLFCPDISAAPVRGGTLIVGKAWDALTLDPGAALDGESFIVTTNIFENLAEYEGEQGRIVPCLAVAWSPSPDYRTWTFTLRQQVRFHDGTPFNAGAVKFNIDRWTSAANPYHLPSYGRFAAPLALLGPEGTFIQKVQAPDSHTIRITLASPSPRLPEIFAQPPMAMVSPESVRKYRHDFNTHPSGTGPFRMAEWRRDKRIILDANQDYWGGSPWLDRVIMQPVWGAQARRRLIERGGIDFSFCLRPEDAAELGAVKQLAVVQQRAPVLSYLAINCERQGLNDARVRRSILHAVRRKSIVKYLYMNSGRAADSMIPESGRSWEYNPRKARLLLGAAGMVNARFTLYYPAVGRPYLPNPGGVAEDIREQLDKVGLRITLHGLPWEDYVSTLRFGKHDLALWGWEGGAADPSITMALSFDPDSAEKGGANVCRWRNGEFRRLLHILREARDADRGRIIDRMEDLILQEVPAVPLVYGRNLACRTWRVQNAHLTPQGMLRLKGVWLTN